MLLFSGSSNGNVTLSQSAANFSALEIHLKTNDGESNSVTVYAPNGKYATIFHIKPRSSNTVYVKARNVYISGTSIKTNNTLNTVTGTYLVQMGSTNNEYISENTLYITQVIGIR